ncbi:MAG: SUMF1/EgtB/PvdO family nonheme iron enzyme [Deltaproteobacteria bacterium]|nr:SUMF1/EgtB/PvdO family nonheme iron enzyme [Deltaproteobacteria bacterium]
MSSEVTKIRVFIASPGDVTNERAIAESAVLAVSRRMGESQGFVLDAVRWETHALKDGVRPQAAINQHVRDCDIFVGILWSRFGTPTSVAESGTEEEFNVAEATRKETGDRPTIWMFFSNARPDPKPLRTPDGLEQWKKVTNFRARYEAPDREPAWFVTTYEEVGAFERTLRELLVQWCAQRFGATVAAPFGGERADLRAEYLKLVDKHRHLSLAGFPTALTMPIDLDKVLVPIRTTIAMLDRATERAALTEASGEARDFSSAWQFALERDLHLVAVLGHPGSGKTTLLKHLALLCAGGRQGELGLGADTLPVFVPLRNVRVDDDFAPALQAASDPAIKDFPPRFFAPALTDGRCLLLCDGLDEVANRDQRIEVSRWIERLAERYPDNRIVVTSRFAGYRAAPLQAPHLQLDVAPLRRQEVDDFLRRWYRVVYSFLKDGSAAVLEQAEREASTLAERIWDYEALRRLAVNPMLLQLIALVRYQGGDLPDKRVELYEKCVDMLLEHWDKARRLDTGLRAKEAREFLQPLALWMHGECDRRSAREDEIRPVLSECATRLHREIDTQAFLDSVRDRSGLLTGYGTDEYGFLHLSFQEYLAAEEIRNQRRFEVLIDHYDESWWREVTRLFAGLHNPSFFSDLMRAVAAAGKLRGHESFTAECIRDAQGLSAEPFVEAARPLTGWRRFTARLRGVDVAAHRYAALLALRAMPRHTIEAVADRLEEIARRDPSLRPLIAGILSAEGVAREVSGAPVDQVTGLPLQRTNPTDGTDLVFIPAGPFLAGGSPTERSIDAPFYLARYLVTNAQYAQFLNAKPHAKKPASWDDERFNQPQQPVVGVNWHDAQAYCQWAGLRLPTEWEWEKGARGTDGRRYPWGEDDPDPSRAVFGNPSGQPAPVGSCRAGASPYGLMDMAGNVWEWTDSWYDNDKDTKTLRGGSFDDDADVLRAACRIGNHPDDRFRSIGFRCAQDPEAVTSGQ